MKYNDNGEYKDIYVKAFDTLPIGTEVDYDGSVVPSGWEEVESPKYVRSFNIESPTWTYNQNVKFYTLPYTEGIHSYIITGVVSYAPTALYSKVMLLVTQTGTNVSIDKLVGANSFSAQGVDLYVTNTQAQSTLHLYGVCYVLR